MGKVRIIDRILQFVEYLIKEKKINTVAAFEKKCGFYNGFIPNQKRGKGSLDGESLFTISQNFPELNIDWVVTGRGSMLTDIQSSHYKEAYDAAMSQIAALNKIIAEENKKRTPKK